jgi:hypothetical protein
MATPHTSVGDVQPRELAELLDAMAQRLMDADREMAQILTTARDSMAALAWNRWSSHLTRQSARRDLIRRARRLLASRTR